MSPEGPRRRLPWFGWAAALLLALFLADRLLLIFGQPDLLHDLDPGELKHMRLGLEGLPAQDGLIASLGSWLSSPENIHHGGFPTVSALFAVLSKITGADLQTLRLIPIASALAAAGLVALWLRRRAGDVSALLALALLLGAPLLFLKWTCVARGGHTEAVLFAPLIAILLDRALRSEKRMPWLLAGMTGGFAVYFSYLTIPLVLILSAGGLAEAAGQHRSRLASGATALLLGGLLGFMPWILGWLVLDVPYFEATIHASANPNEALEVYGRGVLDGLRGALEGLHHNLWPWTFTELLSPAYHTDPSDLLPFEPNSLDWLGRGLMAGGGILALAAAYARRSPMTAALALLPALHYLFVIRLANPGAWPDIPHRYLILVFPVAVANAALGVGWLLELNSARGRLLGRLFTGALVLLATLGLSTHARWLRPPQLESLSHWDVPSYLAAGLGQVRLEEAEALGQVVAGFEGPLAHAKSRGVGRIFIANADYYLLWRPASQRSAPYPRDLFAEPDPLTPDDERHALVEGAYAASVVRAAGDQSQLASWLCSWRPGPQFEEAAANVLAKHQPPLRCQDTSPEL